MIHLAKAAMRFGITEPVVLPPLKWANIAVTDPLQPGPFQNAKNVRVIVTANGDVLFDEQNPGAAAVCIVSVPTVNPLTFQIAARNASQQQGELSFSWLAIEEVASSTNVKQAPMVRIGRTVPRTYTPQNAQEFGDPWQAASVNFTPPPLAFSAAEPNSASFLLTATDPFGSFAPQAVAVSGAVRQPTPNGFQMAGLSTDSAAGSCAFNYVALSRGFIEEPGLVVDTGVVSSDQWGPGGGDFGPGGWGSMAISFSRRFTMPPVILLTPNNLHQSSFFSSAAIVGLATQVTEDYFMLRARNSDTVDGSAGFYWVAIGCAAGCGQGNSVVP